MRRRPPPDAPPACRSLYDAALRNVRQPRRARFRGLVRAALAFRRLRLRAAEAVYAPGGTGFAAAAASFNAAVAATAGATVEAAAETAPEAATEAVEGATAR